MSRTNKTKERETPDQGDYETVKSRRVAWYCVQRGYKQVCVWKVFNKTRSKRYSKWTVVGNWMVRLRDSVEGSGEESAPDE